MIRVQAINFQRTKDGPNESGVIVNDDQLILDAEGKAVPAHQVWDYRERADRGVANFLTREEMEKALK